MIPVTPPLGRSERRVAAACYVQGLLMPGQRTVPSVSIAAAESVARLACLPTAHWKGRNRSMVQHGSGNVSPAQSPLLLSSAGTSLASALLLTLSFIPGAPPCRRRQRLRLCPGSQPPNGRSGLLPCTPYLIVARLAWCSHPVLLERKRLPLRLLMKPSELPGARRLYRLTNRALAEIRELWQYVGEG